MRTIRLTQILFFLTFLDYFIFHQIFTNFNASPSLFFFILPFFFKHILLYWLILNSSFSSTAFIPPHPRVLLLLIFHLFSLPLSRSHLSIQMSPYILSFQFFPHSWSISGFSLSIVPPFFFFYQSFFVLPLKLCSPSTSLFSLLNRLPPPSFFLSFPPLSHPSATNLIL